MKLTYEQLAACIHGAAALTQNPDDSVRVHRFTEAQRAIYVPEENGFFASEFAANATLDFYTDAESITITLSGRCRERRPEISVDILENGTLQHHLGESRTTGTGKAVLPYGPLSFSCDLSKGEKRVTVYLCYGAVVDSLAVELPDGASLRPYTPSRTMVTFGDSITHGSTVQFSSMSYISQLSRRLDAAVHNYGIGGEVFRGDKIIPGTYPAADLVTVAYGTNDYGHEAVTRESFSHNMPEFFRRLHAQFPTAPTFVLLPLWCSGCEEAGTIGTLEEVRQAIRAEAEKYENNIVIDCQNFVPQLPEFFADKVLHPNDLGMTHYAANLYLAIKEHLK